MDELDELARAVHGGASAHSQQTYLLTDQGQQSGPYTSNQIAQMLAFGQITASALVWTEGMSDWASVTAIVPPQPARQSSSAPHAPVAPRYRPTGHHTRRGYRARVGVRSFLFQLLLIIWTGVMLFVSTCITEPAYPDSYLHMRRLRGEQVAREFDAYSGGLARDAEFRYMWHMLTVWGTVALVLGVAAIATVKSDSERKR